MSDMMPRYVYRFALILFIISPAAASIAPLRERWTFLKEAW